MTEVIWKTSKVLGIIVSCSCLIAFIFFSCKSGQSSVAWRTLFLGAGFYLLMVLIRVKIAYDLLNSNGPAIVSLIDVLF